MAAVTAAVAAINASRRPPTDPGPPPEPPPLWLCVLISLAAGFLVLEALWFMVVR